MKRRVHARSAIAMGTVVTIEVVGDVEPRACDAAVDRAFQWFHNIESCCSRFDSGSELMQLAARVGEPVRVSAVLFEAVQFAVAMAEETGGAFDPTVGAAMESRGFNREHRTGEPIASGVSDDRAVSYRDVRVDPAARTVTILRSLVLDLGAVAKGLAVDMAAEELRALADYAIDAGGDLYLAGANADGEPWRVGIRDPRESAAVADVIRVSDRAVCTSGDYERLGADGAPHIIDPRTRMAAGRSASVTVVAETAMLADAAATAAFVLGPEEGIATLERLGLEGMVISSTLERFTTRGFPGESGTAVFPNAQRAADNRSGDSDRDRSAGGRR